MQEYGWYLVAYDIADTKRRQTLHRHMRREGMAVQKSVFVVQRSRRAIESLMDDLARLIHRHEDDLRAYPIGEPSELWLHGAGVIDGEALDPAGSQKADQRKETPKRGWWRRITNGASD